jgi:hypothetical protein
MFSLVKNWVKQLKYTANNGVFKTHATALSRTGEYAQFYGGTVCSLAGGMNATRGINAILIKT